MALKPLKCPECGANIELDDTREFGFCNFCGTKVMLKEVIEVHHKGLSDYDRRQEQIEEMQRIRDYVNRRCEDYTELGSLRNLLNTHKPEFMAQTSWNVVIIGVILIGFIWFIDAIVTGEFPVLGLSCIIASSILYAVHKKAYKEDLEYKTELIETINIRNDDLREYYEAYKNCPVGMEYFCPSTIDKLYNLMKSGRADTIKEAINVYEDDKHKDRMEQQQAIIAKNTAIAAKMSTVSAINSFRK